MLRIKNRSSSYKDQLKKESPIRTQKVSTKNEFGNYQFFPSNNKLGNTKKMKQFNAASVRTNQPQTQALYKEPMHQHANLLKEHNFSLNNFKTEMRLPQTQNFLAETQFVKSPFLSKTLKGMMQPSGVQTTSYGKVGNILQATAVRRQRDPSTNSSKSKREVSGSQKKVIKGQTKLFNNKKLSFNQSNGRQFRDLSDILTKKSVGTNKIYSRNENGVHIGPGCFLTTGDGVNDKRYSNRAKQPKQTYHINSKNSRMNKTMMTALNKSAVNYTQDYVVTSAVAPPKRSGSGKAKKPKSGR
jgi:hypothetical protein